MKLGKYTVAWDYQHTLVVIGSAIGGALVAYLQTQPLDQLLSALTSGDWNKIKPILIGAATAVVGSLVALAKHTFLTQSPPISPDSVQRGTVDVPKPTSFLPPPPANKRVARFVGAIVMAACVAVLPACGLLTSTKFPQDILAEYTCVQTQVEGGDTNPVTIMAACDLQEEQIVLDAMTALLGSASWRAAHPAQSAKLAAKPGVHGPGK